MELTITTDAEPQADGWTNVAIKIEGDEAEPLVVGQLCPVEGTEEGPTTWYDARVFGDEGVPEERRFMSWEAAVLAMALHSQTENRDTRRALGWT